ncbi:amine dehydrogenase large subunit [Sphingomonas sp. CJ20]
MTLGERIAGALAALGLAVAMPLHAQTAPVTVPEVEESDVAVLPALSPHWVVTMQSFGAAAARIVDGDTAKIVASIHIAQMSNVRFDPAGRFVYVAETIWTKGNRGTRQDMVTVYDARTLKLLTEIPLPGRLLTGYRQAGFDVSTDGKWAYVYDLSPASAVVVVDLAKRRVAQVVEVAGCGLAFAAGPRQVASLCGDGTLSTLTLDARGKGQIAATQPFFDADADPVFDNAAVDPRTGRAFFLTYSGMVHETVIGSGAQPVAWSLNAAAGMAPATTAPQEVAWRPGGRQLMAYHAASGRLYVLMHKGAFWSHKVPGEELWEVDVATRKVLRRRPLTVAAENLAVSPDAAPLLFLNHGESLLVLDGATLEPRGRIDNVGLGVMTTVPGGAP